MDPARLYSLVQSGTIQLALGAYSGAQASAEAALVVDPSHAPARICAAAALLASARSHVAMGAPGKLLHVRIYLSFYIGFRVLIWWDSGCMYP